MDSNAIRLAIAEGLLRASGGLVQSLRDDAVVRKAASATYDALPSPARIAIRMTLGEEGYQRLAFQVRDYMLSKDVGEAAAAARSLAAGLAADGIAYLPKLGKALADMTPFLGGPAAPPSPVALPPPKAGGLGRALSIGRAEDADISVDRRYSDISRRHAEISASNDGRYYLADCGSSNGTFVLENGDWRMIKNAWITADQPIRLGANLVTSAAQMMQVRQTRS